MPKITRLHISNFRHIEELSLDVASGGFIAKGGNKRGKTSAISAIKAALTGQDVHADAIRNGADRAEIQIDMEDATVKRVISRSGPSKLTVSKSGMSASKPVAFLTELLGTKNLDPLALYLADAKERRSIIMAALPLTVTLEQLQKYAPEIPDDFDTTGHGLDVLARARKYFYDERTAANKDADEAARNAERLATEAREAAKKVPAGALVPEADAAAALAAAERELVSVEERAKDAAAAEQRTAAQRAEVADLREKASLGTEGISAEVDLEPLRASVSDGEKAVADLEAELGKAKATLSVAITELRSAEENNRVRSERVARADGLRKQADSIEKALSAATVTAPDEATIASAKASVEAAKAAVERARLQGAAIAIAEKADMAKQTAKTVADEAAELDVVVKRLSNEAPAEILAASDGIPGLSLDGDEIMLDGVRLDARCGNEQLAFAIQIARRVNAKSRILVVDGLERVDPDQIDAFVEMATRDSWQLFATRVDRGEVVFEALEPSEQAAAAE